MKFQFCHLYVFLVCLLTGALLVAPSLFQRAEAAVRVCKPHVTSKLVSAATEREAKRGAIQDWTEKAKASGLVQPSWRIAGFKVLKCVPIAGRFECVAHAAPCTIKQKAPPERKDRKRIPSHPGASDV